jgi:hypothetical protein
MHVLIDRVPHKSALALDAIRQLHAEVDKKIKVGKAKTVDWNNINQNSLPA